MNEDSPVMSWNEWDPLEEVIVGRAEDSVVQSDHVEVLVSDLYRTNHSYKPSLFHDMCIFRLALNLVGLTF